MICRTIGRRSWNDSRPLLVLPARREKRRASACGERPASAGGATSGKLVSIVLALVLAFTCATSSVVLAHELHHDCAGEGCAVCAEMAIGLRLSRAGFSLASAPAALAAALLSFICAALGAVRRRARLTTLVFLKVQLND